MDKLPSQMTVLDCIRYRVPSVIVPTAYERWCDQVAQETAGEVWARDLLTRFNFEAGRIKELLSLALSKAEDQPQAKVLGYFIQAIEVWKGLGLHLVTLRDGAGGRRVEFLQYLEGRLETALQDVPEWLWELTREAQFGDIADEFYSPEPSFWDREPSPFCDLEDDDSVETY